MSRLRILVLSMACCAAPVLAGVRVEQQDSGVTVRLRGISAVSADVAWASGREGTVLRTIDGGEHWTNVSVPEARDLDFRDVEGFDADTAVVLSIGPGAASRVYRTEDGGKSWTLTLKNGDERAFFDCMVFEGETGWMLGDPVDGRYQIRETHDGGASWTLWDNGPEAMPDEAAFAASGTCIAHGFRNQLLVVGGGAAARVHAYRADLEKWIAYDTRLPHRIPAAGIFSMTDNGLLVGGDFENASVGGAGWWKAGMDVARVETLPAPRGYRSGAACRNASDCIAVGPTGVDWWNGSAWSAVSDDSYDAVDTTRDDTVSWLSGDKGHIARITWSSTPAGAPLPPSRTSTRP